MPFRFEHGQPEVVKNDQGEQAKHYTAVISLAFMETPEVFGLFMPANSELTEEQLQAKLLENFQGLLEQNTELKMKIMSAVSQEQDYLHRHINHLKEAVKASEERLIELQEFEAKHG